MLDKKYCEDCLCKDGELTEVYVSTLQDGGEWYACPACKGEGVGWVDSEKLLVILWAAMGNTPKQRRLLQEYVNVVLGRIGENDGT